MDQSVVLAMPVRFSGLLLFAALLIGAAPSRGAEGSQAGLDCRINQQRHTCVISAAPRDGLRIQFKGGDQPFFVFTPAGPPTTLNRRMKDAQGRVWLMTGHHSFSLREVGGGRNVIEVTSP